MNFQQALEPHVRGGLVSVLSWTRLAERFVLGASDWWEEVAEGVVGSFNRREIGQSTAM